MFIPTPIIIPANSTRNCIYQDKVRFCEDQAMTKHDRATAFGIILFLIIWFSLACNLSCKYKEYFGLILFFSIFLPFLAAFIYSII